jgi:hypothetical protein
MDALHRGLLIAQDSGNRFNESNPALTLARIETEHGDNASAFDHLTLALRHYHDSGNTTNMRSALAVLAALFDRLGRPGARSRLTGSPAQRSAQRFVRLTSEDRRRVASVWSYVKERVNESSVTAVLDRCEGKSE